MKSKEMTNIESVEMSSYIYIYTKTISSRKKLLGESGLHLIRRCAVHYLRDDASTYFNNPMVKLMKFHMMYRTPQSEVITLIQPTCIVRLLKILIL